MSVESYLEAAESFAELVDSLPADLSGPGLGEWDLRALVGHTSRSLVTVSDYLGRPADQVDLESAAAYVAGIAPAVTADPAGVTERGRAAGLALGEDPATAVRRLLEKVADDLVGADPDRVITTFGGGMRLRDYLPTRTFELVVHGLDISAAAAVSWAPPIDALREAVELAGEVAVLRGEGSRLLRLATGREPGGFSIV
jgi:mycothiol maleylpyruvate isomerase-like protein